MKHTIAAALVAAIAMSFTACGAEKKSYDIGPIFPLSADKCTKYHGTESGSGFAKSCMVTKSECEKASADWNRAMRDGAVSDAIQFSCD
jgi:hypothetical protein